MAENTPLDRLAEMLVTPDREFQPRTPHSYSHIGETAFAALTQEHTDAPETHQVYGMPMPPDTERTLERLTRLGRI